MFQQLARELDLFVFTAQKNMHTLLYGIAIIFAINLFNWLFGKPLNVFAIIPRRVRGIPGIFISFVLHQNFNHLFFNTIPGFALSLFVLKDGMPTFIKICIFIIIGSGILVWLCARQAKHIGMSGVVFGFYGYVLANAYLHPGITSILLATITIYYFAGILAGLLPTEQRVSWESHLFGFIVGICYFPIMRLVSTYCNIL